jgi:hypothetical protein
MLLCLCLGGARVSIAVECALATLKRYFRAALSERLAMRDRLDAPLGVMIVSAG